MGEEGRRKRQGATWEQLGQTRELEKEKGTARGEDRETTDGEAVQVDAATLWPRRL